MEYTQTQLRLIQRQLIRLSQELKKEDGIGALLVGSGFLAWATHAQLAGYEIDKATGRMYREEGNVRTYFD
jgi:hypothetical protein